MLRLARRITILSAFALALTAGRATAQDNFDANKTPAQLFSNDCSGCHKSPAGLAKAPGMFGLESFLREHYTASRQAAAAIAGYLRAADSEQAAKPVARKKKSEPRPKADKPAKKEDGNKEENKSGEKPEKNGEPKADAKEPKSEAKPETKSEAKPAEAKPAESKPAEPAKSEKSE